MSFPQIRLTWLAPLLFIACFALIASTRAQEIVITENSQNIVFSETESLIKILLDSDLGEGLSEADLIYAAASLLETDEPYIDLASSNIPLNGGYAGAVLSNTPGAKVTISFNSFDESIAVTHISGDPVNVEPGHIIVRWEGIEKWVDVKAYGAEIRVRSLAVKLEVAPRANEDFDFLSIKAEEASEFVLYGAFPGSIEGSGESDTFEVIAPSSDFEVADECANSTGEETNSSATISTGSIDTTFSPLICCCTNIITGGVTSIYNPSGIGIVDEFVLTLVTPTIDRRGGRNFLSSSSSNSTEARRGGRNFSKNSETPENNSTEGGGGSFSFYYIVAFLVLAMRIKYKETRRVNPKHY